MKFYLCAWLVMYCALAGLASPATANSGEGVQTGAGGDRPPNIRERFDSDGDGRLGRDEIAAARESGRLRRAERRDERAERIDRYDEDGDGRISREERRAMLEKRREHVIARFDADGDGQLDAAERRGAREARGRRGVRRRQHDLERGGRKPGRFRREF